MKKSFLDIVEEALVNVDEVDCIQLKHAKDNEEDFILIAVSYTHLTLPTNREV